MGSPQSPVGQTGAPTKTPSPTSFSPYINPEHISKHRIDVSLGSYTYPFVRNPM